MGNPYSYERYLCKLLSLTAFLRFFTVNIIAIKAPDKVNIIERNAPSILIPPAIMPVSASKADKIRANIKVFFLVNCKIKLNK